MEKLEVLSQKIKRFFEIPGSLVAVKILEREFEGVRPNKPSLFCDFVRRAAHGEEAVTITENDLQNFAARVILGFAEPKYVDISLRLKPAKTKSIVVAPLEKMKESPDVVIVITNPSRMMEIVQVLRRTTRSTLEVSMTCEASAVAGEITALPFMEKKPNLTLLCGGARMLAGYSENELAIGIPYDIFTKFAETVVEPTLVTALCGCLMDDIPKHLKEAFINFGFDKSTDHFYGEYKERVFRIYLNKDERGVISSATFHYPVKFKSESDAQGMVELAKKSLSELGGETTALLRENWLDLILTVKFPDNLEKLALDLNEFKESISRVLEGIAAAVDKIVV